MADWRAVISACTPASPPEAHIPRRRVVSWAMAAGIADVGSLVELPPCYRIVSMSFKREENSSQRTIIVYRRALLKPELTCLAVEKRASKSDCCWNEPSDLVEP